MSVIACVCFLSSGFVSSFSSSPFFPLTPHLFSGIFSSSDDLPLKNAMNKLPNDPSAQLNISVSQFSITHKIANTRTHRSISKHSIIIIQGKQNGFVSNRTVDIKSFI